MSLFYGEAGPCSAFRGSRLTTRDTVFLGFDSQSYLQHLQLNFSDCEALSDVATLGQGVGALHGLQHLQLGFCACRALSAVAPLAQGIGALQGLQHIQLDFSHCDALSDALQKEFTEQGEFVAAVGR